MFTLAIVGRPNVGKSTLFNRLVGKRLALVDDQPGVTRDLREGAARIGPMRFTVIDTAGLEEAEDDSLQGRMRKLTERAVEMADVALFMIDSRAGVTASDRTFADILRKRGGKVILAANKSEGRAADHGLYDAFSLGLGEPIALSAEHGQGLDELYDMLVPIAKEFAYRDEEVAQTEVLLHEDDVEEAGSETAAKIIPTKPLQIAVVGRPNAGKSTLINHILGEDRLLTGPEAGITRDSIGLETTWFNRQIKIFDTAGIRKRARVVDKLEKLSVADGLRAVRFAEVVILLLDADAAFETQDLRLADLAEREGRAVVIAVNKWDLVDDKGERLKVLRERFETLLPQLRGAPMVAISAKTGRGLDRLFEAVETIEKAWNARISTGRLNRWLLATVAKHTPPAPGGRRIRLRYMTQVKMRPPTFVVFCSLPEDLPESYSRYLVNGLRDDFKLYGTPIRMQMRKGDNPYENKKKK